MRVNLLAREPRARRQITLGAGPVVVLLMAGLAAALAHLYAARLAWDLAQRDAVRKALEVRAAPIRRLRGEIADLQRDLAQAARLRASGPRAEAQLAELAGRLPRSAWLTSLEVAGDGTLRLEGRATRFATIGSLLAEIDRMAEFGTPALLEARRPTSGSVLRFQIETHATQQPSGVLR